MSVLRQKAGAASAEASQMDQAIPRHPHGGPFPHLQDGYRADLPRLIQHARGLIHSGTEPMEVGRFVAEQALGAVDLRCALGYLLSAAISAGGLAVIRSRLQYSVSAANAGELMEQLDSLRCGDCGDVALPTHRCPEIVRLRCCQFHELGGDERHGCGGDAPPRTAPRPRPPGEADRGVDTQVVRELRGIAGALREALRQRAAFDAALQEGLVARQQFLGVLRQRATTECARHGDDWRALQQQVERELADASPEPTLAVSARVGDGSTPAVPGSEHRPCALCNEQVWASPATLALKPDSFICTSCYSRPAPGAA